MNGSGRENLGSAKLCLQQLHYSKSEDKVYTDERTKQKISFESRVLTATLKLNSAFMPPTSTASVTLSVWFQPDLPYPEVDLSRLRPKEEDKMTDEDIEHGLKLGGFLQKYNQVIARNFPEDYDMSEERRFDQLYASDQYRQRHLLPFFLSLITPPDSNQLTGVRNPDTGILELPKGIRTLQEVAHFVRCLPFRGSQDYFSTSAEAGDQSVWASADFVLALRRASLEEHAILMASMFRAVKFEDNSKLPFIGNDNELMDRFGRVKSTKTKGKTKHDEEVSMSDRVFVCLGRASQNQQDQK